jgi:hypothetical protein
MKKPTSKDLTAIGEVLQDSFSSLDQNQPVTMESLKNEFIKKMGERFNGDSLYISHNTKMEKRNSLVQKYLIKNHSIKEISAITGIPVTSVFRIVKKLRP